MGVLTTIHFANEEGSTKHCVVVDGRSLEEAKAQACGRIDLFADVLLRAGRKIDIRGQVKVFQMDLASLASIASQSSLAVASLLGLATWDPSFHWIAADNTHQPMSASDMVGFSANLSKYLDAITRQRRLLKDQVSRLGSNAACDAFDCSLGWPSNP